MIKSVQGKNMMLYADKDNKFIEWFDRKTGKYVRTGIIENGADTGVDPFMRSYPNLLDVGIMGSCQHGKSGLCVKAGVECYQSGLTEYQPDMTLDDYTEIIGQVKGKVQQCALGGRGDPNKHKQFEEILKATVDNGIVPNYTTSGLGLTDREIKLTKKYCGAVAVSWYRSQYTMEALKKFIYADCITNIHYVLGRNSIDEAISRLRKNDFPPGINAVVFLLHKPVGLGKHTNVLTHDDKRVKEFFNLVDSFDGDFKVGFDSCTIPGIINFTENISMNSIDTCEGARFSAYITPDMIITTCSFDQSLKYGVDLRDYTIEEAWNSDTFNMFRSSLQDGCAGCEFNEQCKGSCPLTQEIVLCDKGYRNENS